MALTPQQIAEMDAAIGGATPTAQPGALDAAKIAEMDQAAGLAQEPGFFKRIGNDYDQRLQNLEQINLSQVEGKAGAAHTMARQAAQGLGMAADVGAETVKSLMSTAGEGLKITHPGIHEGLVMAKDLAGRLIEPAANLVREKYRQAVPAGSELDLDLNALGNTVAGVTTVIPAAQMTKAAAPVAVEGAQAAGAAIKAAPGAVASGAAKVKNALNPVLPTANEIRAEAGKAFKYADDVGGVQPPSVRNSMLDDMAKVNPPSPEVPDDAVFRGVLDHLEKNRNQPLTLDAAHRIDKYLTEKIDGTIDKMTGKMDATGYRLSELQDILRDHTYRAAPDQVIGGKQGYEAWVEGNRLWQKQAQMMDIENIFRRAEFAKNPKEAIQNGFKQLALNKKRFNGYDDAIKADIEAAAKGSIPANLLSKMSNGLLTVIGAGVHGVPGAILGEATNIAAQKGATALQLSKANKVAKKISKDHKFVEPAAPAAPLALPPPGSGTSFYADNLGNVSRTPNPANEIVAGQPRPIVGTPADAMPQPPQLPNELLLPSPESFGGFTVDNMGNVIRGNPGEFKSLQDILRMSPENARKYLNSLKGKQQ